MEKIIKKTRWEKKETKISRLLKEMGLTQKDLFTMINDSFPNQKISQDGLARFVCGARKNVHLDTIKRICVVLDVTPNEVVEYENFSEEN